VRLVGFIKKKFVTMHGHMNANYFTRSRNWTGPLVRRKIKGRLWALVQAIMNLRVP
jgi:hypothetical protein